MSVSRLGSSADGSTVMRTALLTIVTGGATFVITNGLDQPQSVSFTLSILIGGIALMVRFLVEFEKRLAVVERQEHEHAAAMESLVGDNMVVIQRLVEGQMVAIQRLVGERFDEISEATALYGLIEASALQTDLVTQVVRNSTQISPQSPPIIYQFVQAKMKEMADFLKQLGEGGTVTYDGEDRDWLLGLTRNATATVDAISLAAVDQDLWGSEIGARYLEAQRRAARGGRRVRRIFVLDGFGPDADDDDLNRACEEQREMGIDVRLLDRSTVPTPLRSQVRSVILFDDILAYESTPAPSPGHSQVAETRLVLTDSRVKEYALLFRELWDLSRVFPSAKS